MAGNKPGPAPQQPGVQREKLAPTERGYATVQLPAELAALVAAYGEQQRIPHTRQGNAHYGAIIAHRFQSPAPADPLPVAVVGIPWDRIAVALAERVPLHTATDVFKAFEQIKEGFSHDTGADDSR